MNWIVKTAIGYGIKRFAPIISKRLDKFFDTYVEAAEDKLSNFDDWLEEKTGLDLFPDQVQKSFDSMVHLAVDKVEAIFTDQAKIRFVLNHILRGKGSFKVEDFKSYANKTWREFLEEIPQDIKLMLSQKKLDLAVDFIRHYWENFTGKPMPHEDKVREGITAVVRLKNENHKKLKEVLTEPESLEELWSRLTKESKDRQDKLK